MEKMQIYVMWFRVATGAILVLLLVYLVLFDPPGAATILHELLILAVSIANIGGGVQGLNGIKR